MRRMLNFIRTKEQPELPNLLEIWNSKYLWSNFSKKKTKMDHTLFKKVHGVVHFCEIHGNHRRPHWGIQLGYLKKEIKNHVKTVRHNLSIFVLILSLKTITENLLLSSFLLSPPMWKKNRERFSHLGWSNIVHTERERGKESREMEICCTMVEMTWSGAFRMHSSLRSSALSKCNQIHWVTVSSGMYASNVHVCNQTQKSHLNWPRNRLAQFHFTSGLWPFPSARPMFYYISYS